MKKHLFPCLALLAALAGLSLPGATIVVTSPAAGDRWELGTRHSIRWTVSGYSGDVRVTLYRRGGERAGIIRNRISSGDLSLDWNAGELSSGSAGAGEDYVVRVVALEGETMGQGGVFALTPAEEPRPWLRMHEPHGGRDYTLGQPQAISWYFGDLPESTRIKLDLYSNLGAVRHVGTITDSHPVGTSGHGSFSWTVGSIIGGTASAGPYFSIKVSTLDDSVSATSDLAFALVAPAPPAPAGSITISSPLAPLTITHSFPLGWNARNIEGNLVINVLREAGGAYTIATGVDPGLAYGRFTWTVGRLSNPRTPFPSVAGQRFCFQIGGRGTDGRGVVATGSWFEIVLPTIGVSEPHGGERLNRGDTKTIRWSAPDLRGGVHIEAWYSRTGGGSYAMYSRLFEDVSNNGHRSWTVWERSSGELDPPPTGNDFRWHIRVISATYPWIFAQSPEFIIR